MSVTLIGLAVVLACIVTYIRYKFSFWAVRNVPFVEPSFPFGNIKGMGTKEHVSHMLQRFYRQLKGKGPIGGIYFSINPVMLALNLDVVKDILIKDFAVFPDRGVYFNERDDPLSAHLFSLDGAKWKNLRARLTPTFTSGKMKFMFPTVVRVADNLRKCLLEMIDDGGATVVVPSGIFEIKDIMARFTTDVIGTCAFGIECNSLADPNAQFRRYGRLAFDQSRHSSLVRLLMGSFRTVARALRMKVFNDDVTDFFMKTVRETVEYREQNSVKRNDFMDLLIEIKNKGPSADEDGADGLGQLSLEEIAAQAFVFFLAGFETSSMLMSYVLVELAHNDDVQVKGRMEIENVLSKHGGQCTYESLSEMVYLDAILNETLRKYPAATSLIRRCIKDYPIAETNLTLPQGTLVMIPIYAIQNDAEYFPDPDRFEPERFFASEQHRRNRMTHLPFGAGPRNCIGLRFGLMQAKIGLVTLLTSFTFAPCARTVYPIEFDPTKNILTSKGGLYLRVKRK